MGVGSVVIVGQLYQIIARLQLYIFEAGFAQGLVSGVKMYLILQSVLLSVLNY